MVPRVPALLAVLLIAATLAAAFPALAQGSGEGRPEGAISLQSDAAQDAEIASRINAILDELDGYDNVSVNVRAGVVTLSGQTLDAAAHDRLGEIVSRVEGVVTVNDQVTESTDVGERLTPSIDRFRLRAEQAVAFLPLLAVAGVAFLLVFSVGLMLAAPAGIWNRLAPNSFIGGIYRQIVRILFGLAGLVVALDILGATALLGSILGAAGIIGLALGFAVRDTVENFLASVMLSIRQPFRPFDLVEIDGDIGKVVRLTSRATILLSLDGNTIRIPNSTVFKSRIVNYTHNPERRFSFALAIDPAADVPATRAAVQEALAALPFVLADPASGVWVEEGEGTDLSLRVSAWIDQRRSDWAQARSEAIRVLYGLLQSRDALRPAPVQRVIGGPEEEAHGRAPQAAVPVAEVADVSPNLAEEAALERIVEADRASATAPDLLARNGTPE